MHFRTFAELKIDMLNSDRASVVVAETTFEISWRWIVRGFLFSSLRLLSAKNEEYTPKSPNKIGRSPEWQRSYLATCRGPLDHSIVLRMKKPTEKPRFSKI